MLVTRRLDERRASSHQGARWLLPLLVAEPNVCQHSDEQRGQRDADKRAKYVEDTIDWMKVCQQVGSRTEGEQSTSSENEGIPKTDSRREHQSCRDQGDEHDG